MQFPIAMAVLVASFPIMLGLCWKMGPGRATPYVVLGAFLCLTRYNPDEKLLGFLTIDKLTIAGMTLILGVLLFDRKTPRKLRLSWVDAPVLLYTVAPLINLVLGKSRDVTGCLDQAWMTFAQWGVPYFMGRIYFSDRDGPRRLSVAVVASALLYIPFCVYEMVVGKDWYLRPILFRIPTGGDYRLGGWRPIVMMTGGLELVAWMSLATILAFWLWACRERWRMRYLPSWVPPIALILTTLFCRGIYGYLTLALGLLAIGLILLTRTRWVLVPFLLLPLLYVGSRSTGAWDSRVLVQMAARVGDRESASVALRIRTEDDFIKECSDYDIWFGRGGHYADSWADGWWLPILKQGGLLAVACHYATFLLPALLFLLRRSTRPVIASAAAGLALFLILQMIDSLHNMPLIAVSPLLGGCLTGFYLGQAGWSRSNSPGPGRGSTAGRPPTASAEPGHATYRLGDITAKAGRPKVEVDVLKTVPFVLALACLLYILGHAKVEGHEGAKFVGGLGSALLFGSVGALVAGSPRRGLLRVVAFGLAFAAFGITFNLGLHPTNRPFWSADILQGMALSGVVVAAWRRLTGGGPWPYAALVALASSWWLVEPHVRGFPGSQYLFAAGTDGISLFPVLPWLTLTALGAWLFELSIAGRVAVAVVLGILAAMGWSLGPIKFPLNPIYAMAGGSLASASFAVADLASRTRWVRVAADWLGQRWLLFFYLHLGIAPVLARLGQTSPLIAWPLLAALSLAATWAVSLAMSKLKFAFEWPASWAGLFVAILAVGLVPGIPAMVVVALAGGLGLIFAARHDDLAALILGPTLTAPLAASVGSWSGYAAKVMLVVAVLVAPELFQRLPAPFGIAPAAQSGSEASSAARVEEP
jgi:hypothetical protein